MGSRSSDGFDPARYAHIPDLGAHSLLALARALLSRAPARRSVGVDRGLDAVLAAIHQLELTLDELRGRPYASLGEEMDLAVALDGVWVDLRDRLRSRLNYAQPGLIRLALASPTSPDIDYAALVERAGRARILLARVFGPEGTLCRCKENEAYMQMSASLLRRIDDRGLREELALLLGEDLVAVLHDLQARFERAQARRPAVIIDSSLLEPPRARLRQALRLYVIAVLAMIDPFAPMKVETIEHSLAPLLRIQPGHHYADLSLDALPNLGVSCA